MLVKSFSEVKVLLNGSSVHNTLVRHGIIRLRCPSNAQREVSSHRFNSNILHTLFTRVAETFSKNIYRRVSRAAERKSHARFEAVLEIPQQLSTAAQLVSVCGGALDFFMTTHHMYGSSRVT